MEWTATREAGLQRLTAFLPRAGRDYARMRNEDLGPGRHEHVSGLSPWLRHRLIREDEVMAAAVDRHGAAAADKFLQEVFWRTYWKGWLELRPHVWQAYRREVAYRLALVDDDPALARRFQTASAGRTGIACFDTWADELARTGYLHNHARMWFASIWIFTLELPWALGADHFQRYLLDGDPASNTLSWRWVAGLHTRGKTYLARPDNIARFTRGRFRPGPEALAGEAPAPAEANVNGEPRELPAADGPAPGLRTGVLFTEDELSAERWLRVGGVSAVASIDCSAGRSPRTVAPLVRDFTRTALADARCRAEAHWRAESVAIEAVSADPATVEWAQSHRLEQVVIPWTPTGPGAEVITQLRQPLEAAGVRVAEPRTAWDESCWPHATRGYFPFRKQLPNVLERLVREPSR